MTSPPAPGPIRGRGLVPARRWIAAAVVAGAVLAMLGPFGSYMNRGSARLLGYWVGAMLLGLVVYGSAYRLVRRSIAAEARWWWPALVLATLLASIPQALATRAAAFRLWPELALLRLPPALWYAQTVTLGLIAMAGTAILLRRAARAEEDALPVPAARGAATLCGDVLALQMEDHYVRVHRPAGSELILMPLGRAIAAVRPEGLRTHRSWWVAAHAVTTVEGDARSMRLRLSNGAIAPVARSAVAHLKAAGWIADPAGGP